AMSRSAAVAVSERINRVGYYGGANVRLQPRAADNIDRAVEQTGDVVFQTGVVEHRDMRHRIKFHHDIDVTVRAGVATCARTEQRGVTDAARAQGGFILPQLGEDFLTVHRSQVTSAEGLY